jgi:2'-hydroxyisoflavone reductase
MANRRTFIGQFALASSAMALSPLYVSAEGKPSAAKPMRVLLLGATGFLGRHFVQAGLQRGHTVSAFLWSRDKDKKNLDVPDGVERLFGDRNGDLNSITGRDWEAVMDLATYGPAWVKSLGEALHGRVQHYTFISSDAVYVSSKSPRGNDEHSAVQEYRGATDPYTITNWAGFAYDGPLGEYYPALKVLCEREAERQFPGRSLLLRPGPITGPGEYPLVLGYWAEHMTQSKEVLAAGDPHTPVQFIDARDIAAWAIRAAEQGFVGVYNMEGPEHPMSLGRMLEAIRNSVAPEVKITWVDTSWLLKQQPPPGRVPFTLPPQEARESPGIWHVSNAKARAKGLNFTPVAQSATDSMAWRQAHGPDKRETSTSPWATLSLERERELLQVWHEMPKSSPR